MDGTETQLIASSILPMTAVGGSERRVCAVFTRHGGDTLAIQTICVMDGMPTVSVFLNWQAVGRTEWRVPVPLALDHPVPAWVSLGIPPMLLRDEPSGFEVAWPLVSHGYLSITAENVSFVHGSEQSPLAAVCVNGDQVFTASQRNDASGEAAMHTRSGAGEWHPVSAGGLPCAKGEEVTALEVFEGYLHAAKSNAKNGFELWRAPIKPRGSAEWEAVITRGAWRYASNPSVSAMKVIGTHLFVAAAGPNTTDLFVGDEHPEILTIDPEGHWALFSGQARFTPEGLKRPKSVTGPGSPECGGLAVGGFVGAGDDFRVWLKPRDGRRDIVSIFAWSEALGEWSPMEVIQIPDVVVSSVVTGLDGMILVAGGTDAAMHPVEPGTKSDAGGRRKSLLTSVAARRSA